MEIRIRRKEAGNRLELVRRPLLYGTAELPGEEKKQGYLDVLQFPGLQETGVVDHFFTTRQGGVSEGIFASMNIGLSGTDNMEHVKENYERVAAAFGSSPSQMVMTFQIHGTKVIRVGRDDAGKGPVRERGWDDVDGMVTDEPGLILGTFFADCVPLMLVDPARRAIGTCHSGWKGTVGRIGAVTLEKMREEFGTRPEDVICAIGPSICRDCYEVSEDVAGRFRAEFAGHQDEILTDKGDGHSQLDLWAACRITFLEAGIRPGHILTTDICTCCNPEVLFSHRATRGQRGNFGGFIMLT